MVQLWVRLDGMFYVTYRIGDMATKTQPAEKGPIARFEMQLSRETYNDMKRAAKQAKLTMVAWARIALKTALGKP